MILIALNFHKHALIQRKTQTLSFLSANFFFNFVTDIFLEWPNLDEEKPESILGVRPPSKSTIPKSRGRWNNFKLNDFSKAENDDGCLKLLKVLESTVRYNSMCKKGI